MGNKFGILAVALAVLGGCSLFESDEEEPPEVLTAQDLAPTRGVPIQAVREIEIGRTRNGFVISAFGTAPELGYSLPRLRPRREGKPGTDGYLDYDFVADPPKPGLERGPGTVESRALRADALLKDDELGKLNGIRVHALAGGLQLDFADR